MTIDGVPLTSTARSTRVHSAGYDHERKVMIVAFRDKKTGGVNAICKYEGIGAGFFLDFMNAPSMGRFVHEHFKGLPYVTIG